MSNLIFCKFLDAEGNPRGRDYTYKTDIDVQEGDYVLVEVVRNSDGPTTKKVIVAKTGLTPDDISGYENFKDAIKTIIGIAPADNATSEAEAAPADEIPTEATENGEAVPEIDMEEL